MDTESAREMIARNYRPGPAPMDENHPVINKLMDVAEKAVTDADRSAERRAVAREAYMAALPMLAANESAENAAGCAAEVAIETVRRWDAFMAAVDALEHVDT